MAPEEPISIAELEAEFAIRGLSGAAALIAAEQKYHDLLRGVNLPYELYIDGSLPVEGEVS